MAQLSVPEGAEKAATWNAMPANNALADQYDQLRKRPQPNAPTQDKDTHALSEVMIVPDALNRPRFHLENTFVRQPTVEDESIDPEARQKML